MITQRDKVLKAIRASASARTYQAFGQSFGRGAKVRWCDNLSGYFRVVGKSSDIVRRLPEGYYVRCDDFSEATCGLVLQLPARDGSPRYYAAYSDAYNDNCGAVDLYSATDDKEEAARDADGMAERHAEECRDADAKDRAEQDIEQAKEDIATAREEHSRLCAEMRAASRVQYRLLEPNDVPPAGLLDREPSAICSALRNELKRLRRSVKRSIKIIKERQDNYWSATSW